MGASLGEGVICESEFASPWLGVLSGGFVQEVTPSHTYCVGDGAGFVVQK